jgi:hypothetical protein
LFVDAASADDVAAFEDEGSASGAGEMRHSGQAVGATTDDDRSKIEFECVDMWLTAGQNNVGPRLDKLTKADEKSH